MPVARVEPGGRLVEEEHARAGDQAGAEVDAPAHAARVGLELAIGRVGERTRSSTSSARWPRPSSTAARADRPSRGSRGRSASRRPRRTARRGRCTRRTAVGLLHHVEPGDARVPRVGRDQRRQDPHERGLARAVRPEQRDARRPRAPRGRRRAAPSCPRTIARCLRLRRSGSWAFSSAALLLLSSSRSAWKFFQWSTPVQSDPTRCRVPAAR